MRYEIVQCAGSVDDWRAEAIDHDNEGVVYVICFSGPDAKSRAEEYAAWKNAPVARELAGVTARQ
jgi:hypothetical protein